MILEDAAYQPTWPSVRPLIGADTQPRPGKFTIEALVPRICPMMESGPWKFKRSFAFRLTWPCCSLYYAWNGQISAMTTKNTRIMLSPSGQLRLTVVSSMLHSILGILCFINLRLTASNNRQHYCFQWDITMTLQEQSRHSLLSDDEVYLQRAKL